MCLHCTCINYLTFFIQKTTSIELFLTHLIYAWMENCQSTFVTTANTCNLLLSVSILLWIFFLFLHPQMLTRCRNMNRNFKGNEYFSIHSFIDCNFSHLIFSHFFDASAYHTKYLFQLFFNIHLLQWQKWWFEFLDWLTCFGAHFVDFSGLFWHLFLKILNE